MGSQNSLHMDEQQRAQFNAQQKGHGGNGSGLHLQGGTILEQIEQIQAYQKSGGQFPPPVVDAQGIHFPPQQQNMQQPGQAQTPEQVQAPPKKRGGPPAARGQISDGSSSGAGGPSSGANQNMNLLTEQNVMKLLFDNNKGGSYNVDSSNSGSDITLKLFDRLRAQQQKQRDEKERQKLLQKQQMNQMQPQTMQQPLGVGQDQQSQQLTSLTQLQHLDPQQQQQLLQTLFSSVQAMQGMTPQQQNDYFNQLVMQYKQQNPSLQHSDQLMKMQQQFDQVDMNQQFAQQQQFQNQQVQAQQQQFQQNVPMEAQGQPFPVSNEMDQMMSSQQPNAISPQAVGGAMLPAAGQSNDMNIIHKVEHCFQWSFGGELVEICGEFNNWQGEKMEAVVPGQPQPGSGLAQKIGMEPATHSFIKFLEPAKYMYKFRVDGNWRYAPDQQITRDERGNENNVVDLVNSKTVFQLLQEKHLAEQQNYPPSEVNQQNQTQQQLLLHQLQQQLLLGAQQPQQPLTPQALVEQQNMLQQTQQALQILQQQQNYQTLDPTQQQMLLFLQQQQALKQNQHQMQIQTQPQQYKPVLPPQKEKPQEAKAAQSQNNSSQHQKGAQHSSARDPDVEQNIYHQNFPEEAEESLQDPQVLPIHFNYNFIERDQIPLHNEKFSKINDEYSKQTDIVKKGFFDNTLPIPSHVVLNHINSWETMSSLQDSQQSPLGGQTVSKRRNMIQGIEDSQNQQICSQSNPGLTCTSMAQRLNRSKFLTIVYYKPSTNK